MQSSITVSVGIKIPFTTVSFLACRLTNVAGANKRNPSNAQSVIYSNSSALPSRISASFSMASFKTLFVTSGLYANSCNVCANADVTASSAAIKTFTNIAAISSSE